MTVRLRSEQRNDKPDRLKLASECIGRVVSARSAEPNESRQAHVRGHEVRSVRTANKPLGALLCPDFGNILVKRFPDQALIPPAPPRI